MKIAESIRRNVKRKKHRTPRGVGVYAVLKVLELFHGRVSDVLHCCGLIFFVFLLLLTDTAAFGRNEEEEEEEEERVKYRYKVKGKSKRERNEKEQYAKQKPSNAKPPFAVVENPLLFSSFFSSFFSLLSFLSL